MFSTAHRFSLREKINHRRLHVLNYANIKILTLLYFIYQMLEFETHRLLSYIIFVYLFIYRRILYFLTQP